MLSVKIDQKDLQRLGVFINGIKDTRGLMKDVGQYMTSSTQRKIEQGIQPENAPLTKAWKKGGLPLKDTGKVISSISFKYDNTTAVIGTEATQGWLIHQGGTIKPKTAKKLYIPAGWKTRQMMRKFGLTPAKCIEGMKAAGYKVFAPKGKKAVMAQQGKGDPFVLFVLKDSVDIPARPFLTVDDLDEQIITEKAIEWLNQKI